MRRGADPWQAAGLLRMSFRRAAVFLTLPDLYLWRLMGPADMSQALYGLPPPPTNAISSMCELGHQQKSNSALPSSALPQEQTLLRPLATSEKWPRPMSGLVQSRRFDGLPQLADIFRGRR